MYKATRAVRRVIEEFGEIPHEIIQCRRHLRLYINGKLVVTLPATMQETAGRAFMNTTADIRRACKSYREQAVS